jgi:hypothetical protein
MFNHHPWELANLLLKLPVLPTISAIPLYLSLFVPPFVSQVIQPQRHDEGVFVTTFHFLPTPLLHLYHQCINIVHRSLPTVTHQNRTS